LPFGAHGLRLAWREGFAVEITMSADEYCEYIMGETNVEAAIAADLSETDARHDFDQIFAPLFAGGARRVGFESELALARRAGDEQAAID
jgi:hypothetical protein